LLMDVYSRFINNAKTWKKSRCLSLGRWINSSISRQ
jgi:hypothetical protein